VDGWRLDVAFDMGPAILGRLTECAHAAKPDSVVIGEIWNYPAEWFPAIDGIMNFNFREVIFTRVRGETSGAQAGRMIADVIADAGLDPIQADHPLYLTCRVIQGGPSCPVPAGPIRLNAVIPGRGNQVVKLGSFTARPGLYEITISPQPGKREGAKSLTFSVEAEPMLQKAPAAAAVPSGPSAISGTPPGGANQTPSLPSSINRPLKR
jgi:hypothetical protein